MIKDFNKYNTPEEAAAAYANYLEEREQAMWNFAQHLAVLPQKPGEAPEVEPMLPNAVTLDMLIKHPDDNVRIVTKYAINIRRTKFILEGQ